MSARCTLRITRIPLPRYVFQGDMCWHDHETRQRKKRLTLVDQDKDTQMNAGGLAHAPVYAPEPLALPKQKKKKN